MLFKGLPAAGKQAIALVHESAPNLILMDIKLKGEMDGIETAQHIHDLCRCPRGLHDRLRR